MSTRLPRVKCCLKGRTLWGLNPMSVPTGGCSWRSNIVSEGVNSLRGPNFGGLIITHYQRILNYIKPDFVHVMVDGRIVKSGGPELALQLEEQGYETIRKQFAPTADAVPTAVGA